MAAQICITPAELHNLVTQEALNALAKIGASKETIAKAVDDDWAFAEEEEEFTPNSNAESNSSSASEKPADPETMTKETQSTTTTQADEKDHRIQKFQVKLAELRKKMREEKTEVFQPIFEEPSGEIEIQFPPNVTSVEQWSTAFVQKGKFKGQRYRAAFDNNDYKKWLMEHFGSLKCPMMLDLAKYVICQTKEDMAKATA